MRKGWVLPPLSADELLDLQQILRAESTPAALFRRCRLIWHVAAGHTLADASALAGLHYTNAHKWLKRFLGEGLEGLQTRPRQGRPRVYPKQADDAVIQAATSRPQELGLGFKTWSLGKLQKHLRARPDLEGISRETIRRILARHGIGFLTGQTWCESNDPDFEAEKTPS